MKKISNFLKTKSRSLTLFDYILATLFLAGIIMFAYLFFRKSAYITATVKATDTEITFQPVNTRGWFAQLFRPGMKEKDGIGNIQAEVLDVFSYDTDPDRKAVYLKVRLRAVYSKSTGQYVFKGKQVLIGAPIKLLLSSTALDALIVDVEGVPDLREKARLHLETRLLGGTGFQETEGAPIYLADAIKVGDTVRNSRGEVVLTITKKTVEPAKRVVTTSDGRVVVRTNPMVRDMALEMDVNAVKIGGKYYLFDDQPLSIGWGVPVNLQFVSIYPTVTKITEVK